MVFSHHLHPLPDFAGKPKEPEITLFDLATHRSGLPRDPDNLKPNPTDPFLDYHASDLQQFLIRHGLGKVPNTEPLFSNVGFGLLGYALSLRAGVPYGELVFKQITGPLHMIDTTTRVTPEQRRRIIQGYNRDFKPVELMNLDVLTGAGALKSTATDMLIYLDANLHPDQYAVGLLTGSAGMTLPAALAVDHEVRAELPPGKSALAWGILWRRQLLARWWHPRALFPRRVQPTDKSGDRCALQSH